MADCPFARVLVLGYALATLCCLPAGATLTVAAAFGDNAVLQRGVELPVWGSAPAGCAGLSPAREIFAKWGPFHSDSPKNQCHSIFLTYEVV